MLKSGCFWERQHVHIKLDLNFVYGYSCQFFLAKPNFSTILKTLQFMEQRQITQNLKVMAIQKCGFLLDPGP